MFQADRVFSERVPSSGATEWFFLAREGIVGPYSSKETASNELQDFINRCIQAGSTGGRNRGKKELVIEDSVRSIPMNDGWMFR